MEMTVVTWMSELGARCVQQLVMYEKFYGPPRKVGGVLYAHVFTLDISALVDNLKIVCIRLVVGEE